ncbi:MAG: PTS sugar transporter subunit IIA [Sedimentisphaerales bacterium]|nr:PTS sugar transporter subunit IIA [Sedimentisphaerales bacterium]
MPYGQMNLAQAASFLGLEVRRVERMAQRGEVPCQKVSGQFRFNRAELTEWLGQRMVSHSTEHHETVDAGMQLHRQRPADELVVTPLLRPEAIAPNLSSRTRTSVLRDLIALAGETGLVFDGEGLLEALIQREDLCSTAMEAGVAIPHPRRPMPYALAEPIIVVARTVQGIGFGAPDGRLTDVFFMTCAKDDRHHLHVLARLCRILHQTKLCDRIRETHSAEDIMQITQECERNVVADSL